MAKSQPAQRYVACASGWSRVRLTTETTVSFLGYVSFLGDFDGEAVIVQVYDTPDIIGIRRTLASGTHAIYDTPTHRMRLASPRDIAAVASAALADDLEALNTVAREELPA